MDSDLACFFGNERGENFLRLYHLYFNAMFFRKRCFINTTKAQKLSTYSGMMKSTI